MGWSGSRRRARRLGVICREFLRTRRRRIAGTALGTRASQVINKLAETTVAPATSVVALIARDYQLEWLGANVCFLGGLFGFVGLLGIRAYLAFGPAFGRFGALLCGAVVTHGCSVVNAGIAAGDGSGVRHASNYLGLVARYVTLVVANAWRTRGPLRILSLLCVVGAAWTASAAARTKHGDDCPLAK